MKRFNCGLVVIGAAVAGWVGVQTAAGGNPQDVFSKANQAKIDPFSELNKAPPFQLKLDDKPAPAKKDDNFQPKDAPQNAKELKDVIDFEVTVWPKEAKRGQTVRVTVTGMPRRGWHTFGMNVTTPDQFTSVFKVGVTAGLQPLSPIQESPEPVLVVDPKGSSQYEHETKFTWSFDVLLLPGGQVFGRVDFPFSVRLQACDKVCILGEIPLKTNIDVLPGEAVDMPEDLRQRAGQKFPPPAREVVLTGANAKNNGPQPSDASTMAAGSIVGVPRDYDASIARIQKQIKAPEFKPAEGLGAFILTGMFWGFVSLITPCVFPMIPITVSFFLKQSEKEHHKPVTMALVYCGTIVIVLTIAAAALLNFFRVLSISPVMNFGLGLLFIFFALSLFGMYDIELPSFLARYTSERERRGGMVGTIFMALTFTIISFACVAPFLGGFGGTSTTATRPFSHTLLGGLAFSVTFASPFFILALFPTLLKAMPKSGAWLNSVKVVMGFLELAAAFKFFRAGELVMSAVPSLFTFDLVMGLWVALCFLSGLYLLGLYRLPHDSPVDYLSVPRLGFSFAFLGLGLYLMPALFIKPAEGEQPRPNGVIFAWVNSFLLPDPRPTKSEVWTANLEDAIAQAREARRRTGKPKLVFIDFTGVTCTNCNLNENDVFTKSEIQQLFKPYVLVKLYTDTIPLKFYSAEDRSSLTKERQDRDAEINSNFQASVFDTKQLPLYVILEPQLDDTVKVVGTYEEGRIMNESAFAAFLRKPQEAIGTTLAAR
jgi:thiol:disulfide interchange protein